MQWLMTVVAVAVVDGVMMVVEEVGLEEEMTAVEASERNLPYRNCLVLILYFQVTGTAMQLDLTACVFLLCVPHNIGA